MGGEGLFPSCKPKVDDLNWLPFTHLFFSLLTVKGFGSLASFAATTHSSTWVPPPKPAAKPALFI